LRNNSWTSKNSEPSILIAPKLLLSFIKFNIKILCVVFNYQVVLLCLMLLKPSRPLTSKFLTCGPAQLLSVLFRDQFPLLLESFTSPSHLFPSSCHTQKLSSQATAKAVSALAKLVKGLIWRKWFQNLPRMSFVTVFKGKSLKRSLNVTMGKSQQIGR